jgi:hypothetical protein
MRPSPKKNLKISGINLEKLITLPLTAASPSPHSPSLLSLLPLPSSPPLLLLPPLFDDNLVLYGKYPGDGKTCRISSYLASSPCSLLSPSLLSPSLLPCRLVTCENIPPGFQIKINFTCRNSRIGFTNFNRNLFQHGKTEIQTPIN